MENTNDKENVFDIVGMGFEPPRLDRERLRPYSNHDIISRFARSMTDENGELALNYLKGIYIEKVAKGRENFPLIWARERKELLERMASESPEKVETLTHAIGKGVYEGMLMVDDFAVKMGYYRIGEVLEDVYDRVLENIKPTITSKDDAKEFAWSIAHEWLDETHEIMRHPRKTPIWKYKP